MEKRFIIQNGVPQKDIIKKIIWINLKTIISEKKI